MLYMASPIFHRDVFQKPISHTNNKLNEHGGGACDDLRSRVFYNIVIHIRQGSGDTRGTCRSCKCPKVQKAEQARRKRSGDDKLTGMCPGMCQDQESPKAQKAERAQSQRDAKPTVSHKPKPSPREPSDRISGQGFGISEIWSGSQPHTACIPSKTAIYRGKRATREKRSPLAPSVSATL